MGGVAEQRASKGIFTRAVCEHVFFEERFHLRKDDICVLGHCIIEIYSC
jgi:hypothetical protein